MSVSPTRSISRSLSPRGNAQRSPSPRPRHSPSPSPSRKFEFDKKPEPPKRRGCAFIQSDRGCRKGNACTFSHDPADVADPRWHKCAGAGCTNLCRGTFCPRCRSRAVAQPARRERSRSPRRPAERPRSRDRASRDRASRDRGSRVSRDRARERSPEDSRRSRRSPYHPAYCSQCGRRY